MTSLPIEHNSKLKNIEHVEKYITELLYHLHDIEPEIINRPRLEYQYGVDDSYIDQLEEHRVTYIEDFDNTVTKIHFAILSYLNFLELTELKEIFKNNFIHNFSIDAARTEFIFNEGDAQQYLKYLTNLCNFLSVFHFYPYKNTDGETHFENKHIIERILKNTGFIISKKETTPKNEAQVYKAVKDVLETIFPSCIKATSGFNQTAKTYKPDILIPEAKVAIEYKYAKTEGKLKTTIEQVYADVAGYKRNQDYTTFYAVFYVTDDFWGKEKFKKVWNAQGFPSYWHGIYIVGK